MKYTITLDHKFTNQNPRSVTSLQPNLKNNAKIKQKKTKQGLDLRIQAEPNEENYKNIIHN